MQLWYHINDELTVYARIQGQDDMSGMEVLCTDIDFISGSLCFVHLRYVNAKKRHGGFAYIFM